MFFKKICVIIKYLNFRTSNDAGNDSGREISVSEDTDTESEPTVSWRQRLKNECDQDSQKDGYSKDNFTGGDKSKGNLFLNSYLTFLTSSM